MYDFRSLSPIDFEFLVRDLLQAELGLTLESFGPGKDQGIDFRYASDNANTIVQAKHYLDSGPQALIRAAHLENKKAKLLAPKRYILATSVTLTPLLKGKLQGAMPDCPLAASDILGREDLNNLLAKHPSIERQHFKLWLSSVPVLERILHSAIYNRTAAELDSIREIVPKFVYNKSLAAAENILAKQNMLIVSGEPGIGKTTLARILLWLHAQQGWDVYVVDDLKEAFEIVSENKKTVIFFDDFLGQIRLSSETIREVDRRLPPFLRRVRSKGDLRFIMTTRTYILRQAQVQSERLNAHEINISQIILDVGD